MYFRLIGFDVRFFKVSDGKDEGLVLLLNVFIKFIVFFFKFIQKLR